MFSAYIDEDEIVVIMIGKKKLEDNVVFLKKNMAILIASELSKKAFKYFN